MTTATVTIDVEIITIKGEEISVDKLISRKFRKHMPHYVERVLDINPGLAEQGPFLTVGTQVKLPAPTTAEQTGAIKVLKLWE